MSGEYVISPLVGAVREEQNTAVERDQVSGFKLLCRFMVCNSS